MKINELMLGDIITFKDSIEDETPVPVKVIALGYQHHGNENEALIKIWDNETCDIVTIDDDFVGYPLTPKILEKNGFKNGEFFAELLYKEWQIMCDCSHLAMRHEGGWSMNIPCNCVHQLQHALRICGIEKEIEL